MFVGNIVNPIADARLSAGYSCDRLAKRLKVSKQYISRAEHGTYRSLNENLVKWAASELNVHPERVMQMYRHFQISIRSRTIIEINPHQLARGNSKLKGSDLFQVWRACYWPSITSFSNAFCIHPELVRAYEDGIREEMPAELHDLMRKFAIVEDNWTELPHTLRPSTGPATGSPVRRSKSVA